MKIILSRKGFDSTSGGGPSPILPDGRLLSLPIPESDRPAGSAYSALSAGRWGTYADVMRSLGMAPPPRAHLDPDIDVEIKERAKGWRPAFGQAGAAQRHLELQGVDVGDLFLFFGLFRQTEITGGALHWLANAPLQHVIWGYLEIGEIYKLDLGQDTSAVAWAHDHPHLQDMTRPYNTLYVASKSLGLDISKLGAATLRHCRATTLTTPGESPSVWTLPAAFSSQLSFHSNAERWQPQEDGTTRLHSVARGQEFVIEASAELRNWARSTISAATVNSMDLSRAL